MMKLTWRIWLLIIILVMSLISIFGIPPTFMQKGVIVTSIDSNSTAFIQGLKQGQVITGVDGEEINNLEDYTRIIQGKYLTDENVKTIINTKDSEIILFTNSAPEIIVTDIPKTNIKTGLDLAGGSRALIQAKDKELSTEELRDLVDVIRNRLNVYGIADMNIKAITDLSGKNYMLIEIAGATPKDLEELISKQGKFEAKIGNETVFVGGDKDISSVCRNDARCAGIETCQQSNNGYFCNFRFTIYLSENAATKHAEITDKLKVNSSTQGNYLEKPLDLYLDNNLVDTLLISEGLKGTVTTQISISGSGTGADQSEAYDAANANMHKLQTILITGSLPYELEIIKLDTISPLLGKEFIKSILLAGLAAILAVALVIFIRYRNFKSSMALLMTVFSEIIIILGIASFIEWNLDLLSIAGILATIGTGIDSQIIILDESKQKESLSLKQKLKRAFSIILGAYFTAVVALLPLLWAGAGLLKGFAITTMIGVTVGVLITRPAFSDMIKGINE